MLRLFENEAFVVADKPAGMLSVPSRMGAADPRPCLGRALEAELGGRLWPVHRLDFEVSGLVVFARTAAAHRAASGWFEGRSVRKLYQALTEGSALELAAGDSREWRSRLSRGKKRAYPSPHGKDAVTRARLVGPAGEWLAWSLEPLTGRPHQLRVHLAQAGCPIAGDALYGAVRAYAGPGIALRAVELDLRACAGARELGLPEDLRAAPLFTDPVGAADSGG